MSTRLMNLEKRIDFLQKQKESAESKIELLGDAEDNQDKVDKLQDEIDEIDQKIEELQMRWELINATIENSDNHF